MAAIIASELVIFLFSPVELPGTSSYMVKISKPSERQNGLR